MYNLVVYTENGDIWYDNTTTLRDTLRSFLEMGDIVEVIGYYCGGDRVVVDWCPGEPLPQ